MSRFIAAALVCAAISTAASAQTAPAQPTLTPAAAVEATAPSAVQAATLRLPANTPISLSLNSALTTKDNNTGDRFSLTVDQDVVSGSSVVIPKGTRAVGQVTYAKGNGSFGKSGKMEIMFRYVDLGGKQIPLDGKFYQEGRGNTAGTIGAVAAAGVIGGLVVKGHSVDLPQGKEFTATTHEDVPFLAGASTGAQIDPAYNPAPVNMQVETEKERKERLKRQSREHKG